MKFGSRGKQIARRWQGAVCESRTLRASICFFVGVFFSPVQVVATEGTSVIAIVELYVQDGASGKTAEYRDDLEQALRDRGAFAVIGKEDMRTLFSSKIPAGQSAVSERRAAVEKALRLGADLFLSDVNAAIPALKRALSDLNELRRHAEETAEERDRYLKAEMLLVRALLETNAREEARKVLLTVIQEYGEDLEITRSRFHPSLVVFHEKIWEEVAEWPRGSLRVEPFGAGNIVVQVNGRVVKPDQAGSIRGLLPGTYRVRLVVDGRTSGIHVVEVKAGASQALSADWLDEAGYRFSSEECGVEFRNSGKFRAASVQPAVEIGTVLQADYIALTGVVVSGGEHRLVAVLVDAKRGKAVWSKSWKVASTAFDSNRVVQMADRIANGWGVVHSSGQSAGLWYESVSGWCLTALGVGGLVTSVIFGVQYADKDEQLQNSKPGPGFGTKQVEILRDEVEEKGTIALTAGLVGVVSLATGIVLFLVEDWSGDAASMSRDYPLFMGGVVSTPDGTPGLGLSVHGRF